MFCSKLFEHRTSSNFSLLDISLAPGGTMPLSQSTSPRFKSPATATVALGSLRLIKLIFGKDSSSSSSWYMDLSEGVRQKEPTCYGLSSVSIFTQQTSPETSKWLGSSASPLPPPTTTITVSVLPKSLVSGWNKFRIWYFIIHFGFT